MILIDISTFFGRLHPLMVHLPIGFLTLALIFDLLSYKSKFQALKSLNSYILLLSGISATIACIFGWVLSSAGDYDILIVNMHRNAGILLAILCFVVYFLQTFSARKVIFISQKANSAIFIILTCIMAYVGHQGGSLTHGIDYLNVNKLLKPKRILPSKLEEVLIYEDVIQKILDDKCTQCHQNGKSKGGLIMTSHAALMKGGKSGLVIVSNSLTSELYKRITLDPKHKDFMPTDGKTPLTKSEIEIIKWWIQNSIVNNGHKFVSIKNHVNIKNQVSALLGFGLESSVGINDIKKEKINTNIPLIKIDENILSKIKAAGFTIRKMKKQPLMLDISYINNDAKPDLTLLTPLAKHIIWLNLSNSKLIDSDIKTISSFENIEKLRLENNKIGDMGLKNLGELNYLNSINLNYTEISPQGLEYLKPMKNLRSIYTWHTKVGND